MSARRPAIRLAPRSERDYQSILLYTRRTWGERQRAAYRDKIVQALRRLRDYPQLGQPRDDLFLGCRGLPVEQHVIFYHQPEANAIVVLRILHQRQDATSEIIAPLS
jgi:toxin ParE1/3/4